MLLGPSVKLALHYKTIPTCFLPRKWSKNGDKMRKIFLTDCSRKSRCDRLVVGTRPMTAHRSFCPMSGLILPTTPSFLMSEVHWPALFSWAGSTDSLLSDERAPPTRSFLMSGVNWPALFSWAGSTDPLFSHEQGPLTRSFLISEIHWPALFWWAESTNPLFFGKWEPAVNKALLVLQFENSLIFKTYAR